jgi:hypothetical protein
MARESGEPRDDFTSAYQAPVDPQQSAAASPLQEFLAFQNPTQSQQSQGVSLGESLRIGSSQPAQKTPEEKASQRAQIQANHAPVAAAVDEAKAERPGAAETKAAVSGFATEANKARQDNLDLMESQVKPAIAERDAAQKQYQEAVAGREKYRAEIQGQIDEMDKMGKAIAAEQPHNIWTDASIPVKIAGIALMGLGGAAQALYGDRTNPVTDQIENMVKQDLMLQKMRIDKSKGDYANKNLLLSKFMVDGDHAQNAQDKAYITALSGVRGRLEAIKPLLTDPKMRENIGRTVAELQMKEATAQQSWMQNAVGFDYRQKEAEALALDKVDQSQGTASALINATTKERALNERIKNRNEDRYVPGYQPVDEHGTAGTDKTVEEARNSIQTHATARRELMNVYNAVDQFAEDKGNLASLEAWNKMNQSMANVTVTLKSGKAMNMGANFTTMEKDLVRQGILGMSNGVLTVLNPEKAKAAIERFADEWDSQLEDQVKMVNLKKAAK